MKNCPVQIVDPKNANDFAQDECEFGYLWAEKYHGSHSAMPTLREITTGLEMWLARQLMHSIRGVKDKN